MNIAGGDSQHPLTEVSLFLNCEFSWIVSISFCGLWFVGSSQDKDRGVHCSSMYFIDFIQNAGNFKRQKD